jgi:hypothetical protein
MAPTRIGTIGSGRARAELARVNRDLKKLRAEVTALQEQRGKLLADLEN